MKRSEVAEKYKWKLEKIFPDWESWDATVAEVEAALPALAALQGTLADSGAGLLAAIEQVHTVERQLVKAYLYAGMKSDEDTRVSDHTARKGKVGSLYVRFSEAVSWWESELLAMDPEQLDALVQQERGLELYGHYFHNIQRQREHTLSAEQEGLLAGAGLMARGAGQVFNAFDKRRPGAGRDHRRGR